MFSLVIWDVQDMEPTKPQKTRKLMVRKDKDPMKKTTINHCSMEASSLIHGNPVLVPAKLTPLGISICQVVQGLIQP